MFSVLQRRRPGTPAGKREIDNQRSYYDSRTDQRNSRQRLKSAALVEANAPVLPEARSPRRESQLALIVPDDQADKPLTWKIESVSQHPLISSKLKPFGHHCPECPDPHADPNTRRTTRAYGMFSGGRMQRGATNYR
jgi:hypothetical protein